MTTTITQPIDIPMDQKNLHIPVMSQEVIEHLRLKPKAVIVDCTLGLGGHAQLIAQNIGPEGRVVGIDRDSESLAQAQGRLQKYPCQYEFVHDDFRNLDKILEKLGIQEVDGILFDLGISSYQLENPQRGFSFHVDGPLDMRMDKDSYISAYDLVNSLSEHEISSILKNFGEERWHYRVARYLVAERVKHPIESTKKLTEIVLKAVASRYKGQKIHPATRTFQAIRIAVNRELEALEKTLSICIDCLKCGGRICVLSFHSLEDRIVKQKFRTFARLGKLKLIVKKPLRPSNEEMKSNLRSRSARLRVAEKI